MNIQEHQKEYRRRLRERIMQTKIYKKEWKEKIPKHKMTNPELFDDIDSARSYLVHANKQLRTLKVHKR